MNRKMTLDKERKKINVKSDKYANESVKIK